jgi:hypothetical protein
MEIEKAQKLGVGWCHRGGLASQRLEERERVGHRGGAFKFWEVDRAWGRLWSLLLEVRGTNGSYERGDWWLWPENAIQDSVAFPSSWHVWMGSSERMMFQHSQNATNCFQNLVQGRGYQCHCRECGCRDTMSERFQVGLQTRKWEIKTSIGCSWATEPRRSACSAC